MAGRTPWLNRSDLQEQLPVGDRDDVGRDVRRQVAGLRLDDRQRRQGPAAQFLLQLRRALEQARVQVEDVARVGFAARRTAQQQRDLAVGLRVLRQVVVDDQRVPARVAEELANRARRVGADVEQRRRLGRRRGDDDGVLHRAGFLERLDHLRDRGLLLSDRVVDADDVLALLVDDRVDADGGLARLAVADDQLALAPADRDHRVDGLDARLQRLFDREAIGDARRQPLDGRELVGRDRALAVHRLAERVDHAAEHRVAHRHRDDAAGALDLVAFLERVELAEQHGADAVLFEVQRDAEQAVGKLQHLAGHGLVHALHARDAVAHRHDGADFGDVDVEREAAQLFPDNPRDVVCLDAHRYTFSTSFCRMRASCRVTLPSYTVLSICVTTPPMMAGSTCV